MRRASVPHSSLSLTVSGLDVHNIHTLFDRMRDTKKKVGIFFFTFDTIISELLTAHRYSCDTWRVTNYNLIRSTVTVTVHPSTTSTTPFLNFWDRSIPASSAYFEIETYVIALNCFRSGRLLRARVPGCPVPWTALWLDRRRDLNLPKSAFIFCYLTALIQGNLGTHSIPIFSHNRFTWCSTRSATTRSRAAEISGWSSNLISCLCVTALGGLGVED